jgi:hypothetical protein
MIYMKLRLKSKSKKQLLDQSGSDAFNPLRNEIEHSQTRASTMFTLVAIILGIGLPIILQPATKIYFHKYPFILIFISFMLFYLTYTRGTSILEPVVKQKSTLLKILGWSPSLDLEEPLTETVSKSVIWKRVTNQWANTFFLAAIFMEIIEVNVHKSWVNSFLAHTVIVGLLIIIIRYLYMANINNEKIS